MDPQDQRPKRPSLLVGDAEQAKPAETNHRILADIGGQKPSGKSPKTKVPPPPRPPSQSAGSGRWWVAALILALLVFVGIWRFAPDSEPGAALTPSSEPSTTAAAASDVPDPTVAVPSDSAGATVDAAAATGSGDAAVIVEDPQRPAVAAAPAKPSSAPLDATSAELGKVFSPPAPAPVTVKPLPVRPQAKHDEDVDLLTALMRHLDDDVAAPAPLPRSTAKAVKPAKAVARKPAPVVPVGGDPAVAELRLKHCPAANTEPGLACRQRICAQFQGRTPSCPAPQPSAATAARPD